VGDRLKDIYELLKAIQGSNVKSELLQWTIMKTNRILDSQNILKN